MLVTKKMAAMKLAIELGSIMASTALMTEIVGEAAGRHIMQDQLNAMSADMPYGVQIKSPEAIVDLIAGFAKKFVALDSLTGDMELDVKILHLMLEHKVTKSFDELFEFEEFEVENVESLQKVWFNEDHAAKA